MSKIFVLIIAVAIGHNLVSQNLEEFLINVHSVDSLAMDTTNPSNGHGHLIHNTDSKLIFYWEGSRWIPFDTLTFVTSESNLAEIYDITGGQVLDEGAFTNINFGTLGIVDTGYSTTDSSITVGNTGRYEIIYRISTNNNINQRTGAEFYLEVNGIEVTGTRSYIYSRNNLVGRGTATMIKIVQLSAGDAITVNGQVYDSNQGGTTATIATLANGSSLIVKRLR